MASKDDKSNSKNSNSFSVPDNFFMNISAGININNSAPKKSVNKAPIKDSATKEQQEIEEKAQKELEAKLQQEMEEKAQKELAAKLQQEIEEKAQKELEAKLQQEIEEKAQKELEAKLQQEIEEKARKELEAKLQQEIEEKAQKELEAKLQQEIEEKAQKELEAKLQQEIEEKAQKELEAAANDMMINDVDSQESMENIDVSSILENNYSDEAKEVAEKYDLDIEDDESNFEYSTVDTIDADNIINEYTIKDPQEIEDKRIAKQKEDLQSRMNIKNVEDIDGEIDIEEDEAKNALAINSGDQNSDKNKTIDKKADDEDKKIVESENNDSRILANIDNHNNIHANDSDEFDQIIGADELVSDQQENHQEKSAAEAENNMELDTLTRPEIEEIQKDDQAKQLKSQSLFKSNDDLVKPKKPSKKKPHKPLGEKLIDRGLISRDQLEIALQEQKNATDRQMIGAVLVSLGFISESALAAVLTEATGVKNFDLQNAVIDANLIKKIPKEIAKKYKSIPVSLDKDGTLIIATSDLYNVLAIDQVHKYFPYDYKIVTVYSAETDINEIIEKYYEYDMSILGIIKEIETGILDDKKLSNYESGYVNPTVRLVDAFLIEAVKNDVSDLHFEPEDLFLRVRYRIDGQLLQVHSLHKEYWPATIVRIKIMSGMNIAETRLPQDGRISYNILGREIDFRVATQPTIHGENVVMRILDKKKALVPLEYLGYSERNVTLLKKLIKRPEGIIIVTGPTGSGKTTTLYSILNHINNISKNIMTLEDPVEYQLPMIRQTQVREGTGMDFVSGIKSLMRQDPDIIFVGEVRDEATANMAIRASMTGHQVYSSLHTNDAIGSIARLVDIGIPYHLLSGSLIGMIAQRLARKLCNECKEPYAASDEEKQILRYEGKEDLILYRSVGCKKCNDLGYKGRVAIGEIIPVDKNLDELIAMGSTKKKMLEYISSETEFKPMIDDGCDKVISGLIDIEELIARIDITERL